MNKDLSIFSNFIYHIQYNNKRYMLTYLNFVITAMIIDNNWYSMHNVHCTLHNVNILYVLIDLYIMWVIINLIIY